MQLKAGSGMAHQSKCALYVFRGGGHAAVLVGFSVFMRITPVEIASQAGCAFPRQEVVFSFAFDYDERC